MPTIPIVRARSPDAATRGHHEPHSWARHERDKRPSCRVGENSTKTHSNSRRRNARGPRQGGREGAPRSYVFPGAIFSRTVPLRFRILHLFPKEFQKSHQNGICVASAPRCANLPRSGRILHLVEAHARYVRDSERLRDECNTEPGTHERKRSRYFAGILDYSGMKSRFRAERDDVATKCRSAFIRYENERLPAQSFSVAFLGNRESLEDTSASRSRITGISQIPSRPANARTRYRSARNASPRFARG